MAFRRLALKSQRLSDNVLAETDYALLEKLHLLEGAYLTRAAVLLFLPEPERFFTGISVKIDYFHDNANLRYRDEVQGDLIRQVSETIESSRPSTSGPGLAGDACGQGAA